MNNNAPTDADFNDAEADDPVRALADQFRMTSEEMRAVLRIFQQADDASLKSLKHPKVREIIKQRKGRWVPEEEAYADFLNKEFCLGLCPDLDDGATKRAYLSSRLACTKMRISKKFKGKNTGKEVFLRKTEAPDGRPYSARELDRHAQMHRELERGFMRAVLRSAIEVGVKSTQKKRKAKPLPPLYPPPAPPPADRSTQPLSDPSFASAGAKRKARPLPPCAHFPRPAPQRAQLHDADGETRAQSAVQGSQLHNGISQSCEKSTAQSMQLHNVQSASQGMHLHNEASKSCAQFMAQNMPLHNGVSQSCAQSIPEGMQMHNGVNQSFEKSTTQSMQLHNGVSQSCVQSTSQGMQLHNGANQSCCAQSTSQGMQLYNGVNQSCCAQSTSQGMQLQNGASHSCVQSTSQGMQIPNGANQSCVQPASQGMQLHNGANQSCVQPTSQGMQQHNGANQSCVQSTSQGMQLHNGSFQSNAGTSTGNMWCTQKSEAPAPLTSLQNLLAAQDMQFHDGFTAPRRRQTNKDFCTTSETMEGIAAVGMQSPTSAQGMGGMQSPNVIQSTQPNLSAGARGMGGLQSPANQAAKPANVCSQSSAAVTRKPDNEMNLMNALMMQAPCGFEIQAKNFNLGQTTINNQRSSNGNGSSAFANNLQGISDLDQTQATAVNEQGSSNALLSYQTQLFANNLQNVNGLDNYFGNGSTTAFANNLQAISGMDNQFLQAISGMDNQFHVTNRNTAVPTPTSVSELVGSMGCSFPPLLDANAEGGGGGGKRFKPIPDLLSGFDDHVKKEQSLTKCAADVIRSGARPIPEDSHLFAGAGGMGESPYVTSKSFDELHRLLGKGLSSADEMPSLDLNRSDGGSRSPYAFEARQRQPRLDVRLSSHCHHPSIASSNGSSSRPCSISNSSDFTATSN